MGAGGSKGLCKWTAIRTGPFLFSRADNARSLNDIESTLPTETEAKEAAIDQALIDRAAKFLSTHTVELSLPEDVSRSFDEGEIQFFRSFGKKKKEDNILELLMRQNFDAFRLGC